MHWGAEFIGKPWRSGARGPEAFDCWGLVTWIYQNQFGVSLPLLPGFDPEDPKAIITKIAGEAAKQAEWLRLDQPVDGCVVGMGKNLLIHHVGVWLSADSGLVLHASRGGVVAQRISTLRSMGMGRIEFYQYNGLHNRGL